MDEGWTVRDGQSITTEEETGQDYLHSIGGRNSPAQDGSRGPLRCDAWKEEPRGFLRLLHIIHQRYVEAILVQHHICREQTRR